jgi:hypothetical protein
MSRSCLISLAVSVWVTMAHPSGLVPAGAADLASASACAKADLALMYRFSDEPNAAAVTSIRLAQAGMRVLEARAACRVGNYADGIILYGEANALTAAASAPTLTEPR